MPGYSHIVVVTGGRDFVPSPDSYATLASYLLPGTKLIHGDCPTGADAWAKDFATGLGFIEIEPFPPNWLTLGRAAGPIRNGEMIEALRREAKPCVVLAFPGNKGTRDMIKKARAAGVHVILCE